MIAVGGSADRRGSALSSVERYEDKWEVVASMGSGRYFVGVAAVTAFSALLTSFLRRRRRRMHRLSTLMRAKGVGRGRFVFLHSGVRFLVVGLTYPGRPATNRHQKGSAGTAG